MIKMIMDSQYLLRAVRAKHPMGALVPEVTIHDAYMEQAWIQSLPEYAKKLYEDKGLLDSNFEPNVDFDTSKGKFTRRIDALLLNNRQWTAIEVKISRADFFRDTLEKRSAWMNHTHRFVYLTPPDLITKEEVPEHCGWWTVNEYGRVHAVKRAKINKNPQPLPEDVQRNLFYRLSNFERTRASKKNSAR